MMNISIVVYFRREQAYFGQMLRAWKESEGAYSRNAINKLFFFDQKSNYRNAINMLLFFDQVGELEADSDHWCGGRCSGCPNNRLGRSPCSFLNRSRKAFEIQWHQCFTLMCS